jgi:hypothetical protein
VHVACPPPTSAFSPLTSQCRRTFDRAFIASVGHDQTVKFWESSELLVRRQLSTRAAVLVCVQRALFLIFIVRLAERR